MLKDPKSLAVLDRTALIATLLTPLLLMHAHGFAEVSLSLAAICFVLRSAETGDWAWAKTPWVALSLVWWGWMVLGSLPIPSLGLGENQGHGLVQGLLAIRFPLFAAALAFGVLRDPAPRRWMFATIAISAAYVSVHLVFQFVFGVNLYGQPKAWDTLLTGPFGTARAAPLMARILPPVLIPFAARYLIPVVPTDDWYSRRVGVAAARKINEIPAGRPLEPESKVRPAGINRRFLPYIILMGGLAVVAIIGQRIPVVIMIGTLAVASLLIRRMRPVALAALVATALLIPSFALISPKTYQHMVVRTQTMAEGFAVGYYGEMYNRAFEIGHQNPWTGLGFDGFRLGCLEPRYFRPSFDGTVANGGGADICWVHPHNFYFQALVDGGVPGLALFCAFGLACLIPLGRGLWRNPDPMRVGLFAVMLAQIFPVQSTPSFWSMPMGGWFFLLLGWAMAETYGRAETA